VLRVGQGLAELLVTAVEVADDGVHTHHRFTLERQDGAEDAVGGRMLRPHVHGEALAARVPHLDDLPRFGVHDVSPQSSCLLAPLAYSIGEWGDGFMRMDFISSKMGVALPRKPCHSGSCITFDRTAARSLRSLYAHRWMTSLSWPISVWNTP